MSLSNLVGLYALVAILIAGLVGYFLIMPQLNSAQDTADDIQMVEAEIDELQKLIQDTQQLRENYEDIEQDRDQILSLLPRDNEEEYLLTLTSQTASRNGAVMTNFRPEVGFGSQSAGEASGIYRTYQAKATIAGKHQQIMNFLRDLESSSRFVHITEMVTSSSSNVGLDNPDISATLTIQAYYQSTHDISRNNDESSTGGDQ